MTTRLASDLKLWDEIVLKDGDFKVHAKTELDQGVVKIEGMLYGRSPLHKVFMFDATESFPLLNDGDMMKKIAADYRTRMGSPEEEAASSRYERWLEGDG